MMRKFTIRVGKKIQELWPRPRWSEGRMPTVKIQMDNAAPHIDESNAAWQGKETMVDSCGTYPATSTVPRPERVGSGAMDKCTVHPTQKSYDEQ